MSAKQLKDQQHLIKTCVQLLDKCVSQTSVVFCVLGSGFWVISKFALTVVVYCCLGSSLTVPLYLMPINNMRDGIDIMQILGLGILVFIVTSKLRY